MTTTTATATIALAQGHVGVNAFPWARVTSVRNLDNGQTVDIGPDVVTPAAFDLAPGRYEVTLANPNFPKTITRTVAVEADRDGSVWGNFTDGASAKAPDFGGGR